MVDINTYFKEGIKTIKKLLKQGNFQNAALGCQELLKLDPYNRKLQRFLRKIEKKILNANLKKVKKEIKKVAHLWKEGRYSELLQIYNQLYQYAPQYEKLYELIEKAEAALGEQERNYRKKFTGDALSAVRKILKEKRFGEVIQACQELLVIDPRNQEAQEIMRHAKDALIDIRLKENERIVDSGDFERALELYESLLKINPNCEKLIKMIRGTQHHIAEKKKIERKMQINEGVKRIKMLFSQQEYEKVIEATEQVLRMDQKNLIANLYQRKAKDTIKREINESIFKMLKDSLPRLREEYQKNQLAFRKV